MDNNFQSVTRRILAIVFCISGAGSLTYLTIGGNETALTALIALVGSVIGFYFGAKSTGL